MKKNKLKSQPLPFLHHTDMLFPSLLHYTKAAYSALMLSLLLSSSSVEAFLMLTMGKFGSVDRPMYMAY